MSLADAELVRQSAAGDNNAYRELVERHQAAVSGVAYGIVGDFARSEEAAQEAFLSAWRQVKDLREPAKFKSWVCSIARNTALMFVRREVKTDTLEHVDSPASQELSPPEQLIRHEEGTLVWSTLEQLPENYRVPLILFYREEQSVARVAEALDLSHDAVKQRLARGRELVREEVARVVERSLARTAPGKAFTIAVAGAITSASSAGAATAATAAQTASPIAAKGLTAASTTPWLGALDGLFGAAIGIWAGDRATRYPRERREYRVGILRFFAILLVFMLPFFAYVIGWWNPVTMLGRNRYGIALLVWQLCFFAASGLLFWRQSKRLKQIFRDEAAIGAAPIPGRIPSNHTGRRWTSPYRLFGLPLIDVQFADPDQISPYDVLRKNCPFARGWIAVGERACGVIAIGQVAIGGIAVGGLSLGAIASGGLGVGLVSVSGLAIGMAALGGLAFGGFATGGLAAGWLAMGGVAFGWRAAKGGFALAHDFAVGGETWGRHANDAVAQSYFDDWSMAAVVNSGAQSLASMAQNRLYPVVLIVFILAFLGISARIAYRRRSG